MEGSCLWTKDKRIKRWDPSEYSAWFNELIESGLREEIFVEIGR